MLSNSFINALSIAGTEAINPSDQSNGTLHDTAIAPHVGRKRATTPRMHCFEFRELLQAKRQKWLPQVHAMAGERQELLEIDAALARLSDGSYGTCIDCGGEIGRARLKTEPTAMRCPPCESGGSCT